MNLKQKLRLLKNLLKFLETTNISNILVALYFYFEASENSLNYQYIFEDLLGYEYNFFNIIEFESVIEERVKYRINDLESKITNTKKNIKTHRNKS